MKQIFRFVLLILILFRVTQIHAAGCTINLLSETGNQRSIPTTETSRTETAAYNVISYIHGTSSSPCYGSVSCTDGCCYGYCENQYMHSDEEVCTDGLFKVTLTLLNGFKLYDAGTWDVICESTLVKLSSFTSTPKRGEVILQWTTESETDNAGFNLYRAESENGNYIKINTSLIPAKGSSTQGASYEFTDTDVQNRRTYYYKLEDIDLNGQSTLHGPVSATPRLIYGLK
jgi:hypothetical protein